MPTHNTQAAAGWFTQSTRYSYDSRCYISRQGFSWASVAASAIAAPVAQSVSKSLFGSNIGADGFTRTGGALNILNPTANLLAQTTVSALVSATTRVAIVGGKLDWQAVAADSLSSFVQQRLSSSYSGASANGSTGNGNSTNTNGQQQGNTTEAIKQAGALICMPDAGQSAMPNTSAQTQNFEAWVDGRKVSSETYFDQQPSLEIDPVTGVGTRAVAPPPHIESLPVSMLAANGAGGANAATPFSWSDQLRQYGTGTVDKLAHVALDTGYFVRDAFVAPYSYLAYKATGDASYLNYQPMSSVGKANNAGMSKGAVAQQMLTGLPNAVIDGTASITAGIGLGDAGMINEGLQDFTVLGATLYAPKVIGATGRGVSATAEWLAPKAGQMFDQSAYRLDLANYVVEPEFGTVAQSLGSTLSETAESLLSRQGLMPGIVENTGVVRDIIHKNSLEYVGDTHVYRILGPDGTTYKIGESAQGVRVKDGASIRAEQQVRSLIKDTGDFYKSEIIDNFSDKLSARQYETRVIERFRSIYGEDALPGNKTNR